MNKRFKAFRKAKKQLPSGKSRSELEKVPWYSWANPKTRSNSEREPRTWEESKPFNYGPVDRLLKTVKCIIVIMFKRIKAQGGESSTNTTQ
jgi:hypothetical protein